MSTFPEPVQWNGPDTRDMSGQPQPYRCTACAWTGRGETALRHYRATGHAIRGKHWPAGWPNAQFSAKPNAPYALFAHMQPDFKGGEFAMYHIVGGEHDRSTVSAETLQDLGIPVREERR
jgi:hypothetical protein